MIEIGHERGIMAAQIQNLEWWIAITFTLGSLFFLISAILGFPGNIQTATAANSPSVVRTTNSKQTTTDH